MRGGGRGKREILEKTRRPAASSGVKSAWIQFACYTGAIPTYENREATAPGIEPRCAQRGLESRRGEKRGDYGAAPECKGKWEREIPEKTHRPAASSGTITTYESQGAAPSGSEPGSPSRLDSTVLCRNLSIPTVHWLSVVTVEGDDWASILQEVSYTVWTNG
ncbi:hypothetical protein PR048_010550 [Dryococelus australis]|uniref:Uncharacterized protein n=1 Tax=Dryococelus australis TaxID=614101 RepID=A0ABQ9I324_9NEOP|nr:hypothetical protein PR048_010550 [Dryococelus australis]